VVGLLLSIRLSTCSVSPFLIALMRGFFLSLFSVLSVLSVFLSVFQQRLDESSLIYIYTFEYLSSHKQCEKKRFKVRSFHTCVKFDYRHSLKCFDYFFLYINNLVCLCYLLRSLLFCRY